MATLAALAGGAAGYYFADDLNSATGLGLDSQTAGILFALMGAGVAYYVGQEM